MQVGHADAGGAADTARGMSGGLQAKLARRGAFHDPLGQTALVDQFRLCGWQAFAVKRLRPQAALAARAVDDADRAVKYLRVERVEQEARLARDGGAGNGPDEMAEQAVADAGIVDHGHGTGLEVNRAQPGDGSFACFPTDAFGGLHILQKADAVIGIVAFHAVAFTGNDAGGDAVAAGGIGAGEAVAGGQGNDRATGAGAAAFAVGDALDRARGILGLQRQFA